ncbi:Hypothetical protein GLP15_2785 [Giardia lamblia P15]|uniref:Uncharacterized protein n=1 Tax=Giardia intestinalis (strain P15) TaxID=658858 RepID=E1F1Y7_GIAIA|nr:Hypothetical protein GLP15_2785 [Giardia lamblia P15]
MAGPTDSGPFRKGVGCLVVLMTKELFDPVGLGDLGMLEVTPVTFDPRIPGFILDTIRGLCPCMLSIDGTAEGTVRLEQQVVGMDVSAKIARLDGASRQEAKKASACSVCSRCRRRTLASFVSTGGYDALALCHHLMDDLETLAITGIHGASFFGLRGYYHCEARDFASKVKHRVCILRPMLSVHVSEISRVVFHNGLSCVASDAAECSVSISKTTDNEPFPGERLRARKLLGSVDICGICAFRDRHRQAMAPFTGESY